MIMGLKLFQQPESFYTVWNGKIAVLELVVFLKNSTPGMDVTSLRILCWKKVIVLKVELKHAHCFQYTLNSARK